uniref:Uncharacterized protein n=1 Tax=Heliothis virescens TaxID=7102 RepID=A0A2A4J9K9_HELVI
MVYYITGSNLFGQWLCEEAIINKFRPFNPPKQDDSSKGLNAANLVQISWSYNIFKVDESFYITGAWGGKEQQLVKLPLPAECIDLKVELSAIGNDYKLLLIGKNTDVIWVTDRDKQETKKIKLCAETPVEDIVKKQKKETNITKTVLMNDSFLYLTSDRNVYSGVLPSIVDTRKCRGKVIDIQCGYEHFVLLTDEGRVYTWGNGRRLQLGHGDISSQEEPTEVEALAGIKIIKISAGGWHSLALSTFGDVYAWGWNDTGQLGIKNDKENSNESYSIPTVIDLFDEQNAEVIKNAKEIACGSRHSVILLDDNTIWTTGCNKYGQLGLSEEKYPSLNYFKKVFHCDKDCELICGPWSTVIYSS